MPGGEEGGAPPSPESAVRIAGGGGGGAGLAAGSASTALLSRIPTGAGGEAAARQSLPFGVSPVLPEALRGQGGEGRRAGERCGRSAVAAHAEPGTERAKRGAGKEGCCGKRQRLREMQPACFLPARKCLPSFPRWEVGARGGCLPLPRHLGPRRDPPAKRVLPPPAAPGCAGTRRPCATGNFGRGVGVPLRVAGPTPAF